MSETVIEPSPQNARFNILVIDDNEQVTKLISSFLDMSNHDCTVANDGKEGYELIKTNEFDSIVLDLAMPEFDGYKIMETLHKEDPAQMHKIVVLTASSINKESIEKFKDIGVSAVLQKPVDIDKLLSSITLSVK